MLRALPGESLCARRTPRTIFDHTVRPESGRSRLRQFLIASFPLTACRLFSTVGLRQYESTERSTEPRAKRSHVVRLFCITSLAIRGD
jgi:hypothetical protein